MIGQYFNFPNPSIQARKAFSLLLSPIHRVH